MDQRHQNRVKIIQDLFADSFQPISDISPKNLSSDFKKIQTHLDKIDNMIQTYAPRYPLEKIAKIDLAILRLAIYELLIEKKNPPKVIIDEAVILAKELGNDKSYSFINGVLGSILNQIKNEK